MSTGNRVRSRREELGLTQAELARRIGKTRLSVWRIENDENHIKLGELGKWSRALRVTKRDILEWMWS